MSEPMTPSKENVERAAEIAEQIFAEPYDMAERLVKDYLVGKVSTALQSAEERGYRRGMTESAEIADEWSKSPDDGEAAISRAIAREIRTKLGSEKP